MLTENAWIRIMVAATATIAGCSSDSEPSPAGDGALRPGVEDSNQVYQGTPSANERAFWVAVRNGDAAARATAVRGLTDDLAADPQNGYSQFLVGANSFMRPTPFLRALADGTPLPSFELSPASTFLKDALANLTDPFDLGFAGGLLATIELAAGNVAAGGPRFALAAQHNRVATALITVIGDLRIGDVATRARGRMVPPGADPAQGSQQPAPG